MPYLQNMGPSDLRNAIENKKTLFVGAGSIEYHGSQLPLGTDLIIVDGIIREMEKRADIVVAPSFTYCPTGYMVSGAEKGTVDVHVGTFIEHCAEVLNSYKKMGFAHICILVHHQGETISGFLQCAVQQVNSYNLYEEYGCGWWTEQKETEQNCKIEILPAVFGEESDVGIFGGHAGIGETQAVMALSPELVHMENRMDDEPWWNKSAGTAKKAEADIRMKKLIDAWMEMLNR